MSIDRIKLICNQCNTKFEQVINAYDRDIENGRNPDGSYCSHSCAIANRDKLIFSYYTRHARSRTLNHPQWAATDLTDEYLCQLWKQQNGRCVWTNKPMSIHVGQPDNNGLYAASLDRIDSSLGYVQGNVQFVLRPLNLAKGNYPDKVFVEFLNWLKE